MRKYGFPGGAASNTVHAGSRTGRAARYPGCVPELPYAAFDADNHYYEALDAFTRHVDPAMQPRCVQWCEIGGRKYHVVGGYVSHAVVNPTFDPVAKAGAMHDYFRGNPNKLQPYEFLREREPIPAAYRDRDARVAQLDEHGLEAAWLFPTLGVLYEELLKHDIEAVTTLFSGFNRWLDDDWGFAYQDRLFAAPYLTLADLDWAIRELEWVLERGARTIVMRPAVPHTRRGASPRAIRATTRSGRGSRRRASPLSCTRATADTSRTATRSTGSRPASPVAGGHRR